MNRAFPDAMVEVPGDVISRMPNHPKDRHVLATAVVARAAMVVTRNTRDFGGSHDVGVSALHPDTFLADLHCDQPGTVTAAIRSQAAALTAPPMTFGELVGQLDRVGLRQFAARLHGRAEL